MDLGKLEEIITRAVVEYLVDRVVERLAEQGLTSLYEAPERQETVAASYSTCWHFPRQKRLLSWEDAVQCQEGQVLSISSDTIVSPLAADELARRNVTLIRE